MDTSTLFGIPDANIMPDAQDIPASDDPSSKKFILSQCAINADELLVSIGMEPCAQKWTSPDFKAERDRVMGELVRLRDQSEEYCKITGNIAFFLNAPFIFSQSNMLKDQNSNNWANAILTAFHSFYMESSLHAWPKYKPEVGTYPNYLSTLNHKIRYQSKDEPDPLEQNRSSIYKRLAKMEEEIISDASEINRQVDLSDLKARLHLKSGISMTIIESYFQWKIQRSPAYIDAEDSPVANLPVSAPQKSGKSHLLGPEEATIAKDNIQAVISRVDEMLKENIIQDSEMAESIKIMINQIAYGSYFSASRIAKEVGLAKAWPRIKQKLEQDPVIREILEPKHPTPIKRATRKSASTNRVDVTIMDMQEDEEVGRPDIASFAKRHELDS